MLTFHDVQRTKTNKIRHYPEFMGHKFYKMNNIHECEKQHVCYANQQSLEDRTDVDITQQKNHKGEDGTGEGLKGKQKRPHFL